MDALIVAEGPSGNEVARSREAVGGDPLIDFKADQDGEYILRVSDFLTRGGDNYWYRVRIRKSAQIDFFLPSTARPGVNQKFQIYGRNLPGGSPSGEDDLEMIEMNIDVPELMERQRSGPTKPVNAGMKGFHYSIGMNEGLSNSVFIPFSDNPAMIENGVNDGYAGGCNIGANLARGEYLIFLNNDTIQKPNWISSLLSTLISNSKIAAVQPKILNYYDRKIRHETLEGNASYRSRSATSRPFYWHNPWLFWCRSHQN